MNRLFYSRPLRVGTKIDDYYVMNNTKDGKGELTGFSIDLLNILAQSLHFRYELVLPADGEWGVERDGQWTGLVGLLQRKEIDMAFMLSPSYERKNVVQWTFPVEYYYINIAVRSHNAQSDLWNAFISPFHWTVYLCLVVTFVLCTCVLLHLTIAEGRVLPEKQQPWSPGDVSQFLHGSVLSRGMSWGWSGSAGRTVIAAWCILGFMLTSCYTSKLTSLLVGVMPTPPFTTVKEMLARKDYRWGMVEGTKQLQVLRDSNNSVEQELYRRMMEFGQDDPDVLSVDYNVHLSKILSENYAFIGDSTYMELWAAKHCEISMLPVKLTGLEYYSILLTKDSAFTTDIDNVLLRLQDSGTLAFLHSRWFPPATRCYGNQPSQQTFSLATLQGPFYVAAGGLLLAAGIMCVERLAPRLNIYYYRS